MSLGTALHASAVPVLAHYLRQLAQMLDKAAQHEGGPALLAQRLAPDMFNLGQQVQIAAGFALRAVAPLTGIEAPSLGAGDAQDMAELQRRVAQALAFVSSLEPWQFESAQPVQTRAGDAELEFSPSDFLQLYALPNFFFHLSMAYALLRQAGVPLGKPDFDGWHRYPSGFSFV